MTIKQAIGQLMANSEGDYIIDDDLKAFEIAISALEKQIPKKPLPEKIYYGNGKCPVCNAVFLDKSTKYCGNCGQALNWSDEK